jgi:dihydrofolate synthase/folylpolyglutamate synthase|nr:folylpolyglutamate synthase/dihydrofolate synthase family protein [uncultured Oscillibacter sp.]
MTGQEAVAYIDTFQWQAHAPGLERIRTLLHALGDPQKELKFVHVAGTNGKGSVCAYLASVLRCAGYRVGLCTSPFLEDFRERIQVDGELIPPETLGELTELARPAAEAMGDHPTEFELITAVAMLYFRHCRCDIVVLEVGLGGALDASNVIDVPEAAVITAMGMDHAAILGPTLGDIAAAKAGIIKPGGAVVSFGGCPEADAVIRERCRKQGAQLTEVDFSRLRVVGTGLDGTDLEFAPYGALHVPLVGLYQAKNAAVAVTTVEVLEKRGWEISRRALEQGLASVCWPGRLEVVRRAGPVILRDGAHNAHGMAATVESLRALFPGKKLTILMGVMADKDVEDMLKLLAPIAGQVFTVRPESPRAMPAEELAALVNRYGVPAVPCAGVAVGLQAAAEAAGTDGAVCALGSLYLVGEVRRAADLL